MAKEYLQWQTMRVRQLLDFLQEQVAQEIATKEVVEAYGAEIRALADFPPSLLQAGGGKGAGVVAWTDEMGGLPRNPNRTPKPCHGLAGRRRIGIAEPSDRDKTSGECNDC